MMLNWALIIGWAFLFFLCYISMRCRQHVCHIDYGNYDFDPTVLVSLFLPPVGILFSLAEIACVTIGIKEKGQRAI